MTSTLILLLTTLFIMPSTDDTELLSSETCIETQEYTAVLISNEEPPSINPVADQYFKLSSGFGMRMHPTEKVKKFHRGVDIAAATGTPIIAPSSGVVVEAGYHPKKGNFIEIKHDDNYSTRYWHLHKIDVEVDQEISIGSKIGEIGSTGLSFGPHLHYEVIKNGKNVNPGDYLKV